MTRKKLRTLAAAGCVVIAGGCDVSVTNPGSIGDDYLDDPAAHQAVVNGMSRSLSRALNYLALTGAGSTRELLASGGTVFGITLKQRAGLLDPAFEETNDHWQFSQQARWVAEDGVRRMRESLDDSFSSSPLAAQALLNVGFANRLLGENMCASVIDLGPAGPRSVYFERAEAAFTEAIAVATASGNATLANAARAGRAGVRVWIANWSGASSDASLVPLTFAHQARYSASDLDQYNRVYWGSANQPYRAHTVAGTFYDTYFTTTGDVRVRWQKNASVPVGPLGNPWYIQMKFDRRESPINLATGREMRLIVAEAMLRSGDWQSALVAINQLRAATGVPLATAVDPTQAWTALKRERGIELWLEGRRLGDLYRWAQDKTPGATDDMTGRSVCFPIGQSEINANPNL